MAPHNATNQQPAALPKLALDARKLNELRAACQAEGLPVGAYAILIEAAIRLSHFERVGKQTLQTGRQRIDSIQAVEAAAMALQAAIQKLADDDRLQVTGAAAAQRGAHALAASARHALARLHDVGVSTMGRKRVRSHYAAHIATVAHGMMRYQLKAGDGGPFRRLCDAVFSAAGVYANSQSSLRFFIVNLRPRMKQDGLCL